MKWFKHAASSEMDKKNPYIDEPNSPDVEMTAYTLLTYLQKGLVQDGLPIMRWLVSQQNNGGGFASTQVSWKKKKLMYHLIQIHVLSWAAFKSEKDANS